MFRDYSRNNLTILHAKQHQTVHSHYDDAKPDPTWWQNALTALALLVGSIGLIVFDNWMESPEHLAIVWKYFMMTLSCGLMGLGIWYACSLTKSRIWCQICYPSRSDRY